MGHDTFCDGCGARGSETTFKRLGIIDPMDYCDDCAKVVEEHLQKRDELHEALVLRWETVVEELKQAVATSHPGLRLPDEF